MQQQKPASNGALIASLAFFGLIGLGLAAVGLSGINDSKDAIGIMIFGLVILLGTILITPAVFKGAKKQRAEYKEQPVDEEEQEVVTPIHHSSNTSLSGVGIIVVLIVILVGGVWLAKGAWNMASERINPPKWTGFFYYDPNDMDKYWTQSGLATLDDCRGWVNNQISRDYDSNYDYECGKGCRFEPGYTVQICKETAR